MNVQLSALLFFVTLFSFLFGASVNAKPSSNIFILDQAKLIFDDSERPPNFNNAEVVTLDHSWDKEGFYGNAWYELNFLCDVIKKEPWNVYLPKVVMNAEVWLNGSKIGSGGSFNPPISRQWHSPLSFSVPSKLLEKSNIIHIRVKSYANQFGLLGKVHIGPQAEIQPIFQTDVFESNTLNAIGGALALFFAIILLPVWFKRKDSLYFWFSTACFMWSITSMNVFVHEIPMSEHAWEVLMQVTLGWLPILLLFFVIRLEKNHFPRLEKMLLTISLVFTVMLIVVPIEYLFPLSKIWHTFALLTGLLIIISVVWLWLKTHKTEYMVALVSFIIIALSALYDFAVQWNWAGLKGERFLMDYTILLLLILIGYLMVSHFIASIDETEKLNQELESRVQEAQKHIESNYKKILLLETEQAANTERERIYRNIHDDLGGKLLSMVYRSETNKMADLARSALNDLREIVSHKPEIKRALDGDITMWLKECKTRCKESGNEIVVNYSGISEDIQFSDNQIKHLKRMLSEAVTNSIKHSEGNQLEVTVKHEKSCLIFSVKDTGDYSHIEKWDTGTGMGSLRYRCEQLNGKITWSGDKQGGGVTWEIPC